MSSLSLASFSHTSFITSRNLTVLLAIPRWHLSSALTTRRRAQVAVCSSVDKSDHLPRIDGSVPQKPDGKTLSSFLSSGDRITTATRSILQFSIPCYRPHLGSPLLWTGLVIGIVLSATFSVVATHYKRRKIFHAFKAIMGETAQKNGKSPTSASSTGSAVKSTAPSPAKKPESSIETTSSKEADNVNAAVSPASNEVKTTKTISKPVEDNIAEVIPEPSPADDSKETN